MDTIRRPEPPLPQSALSTGCRPSRLAAPKLLLFALALPLSVHSLPGSLAAQELGMLAGIVSTTERKPLASARISVIGTALATVADTDGVFRIAALPLGTQSVEVKLLGFSSMLVPVQIEAGKTARLDVTLTASAVSIETVKISGDTLIVPAIQGFLERRERGNGKFFTRADIDRMQARLFTDVLRRVPGMQLQMITGPNNNGIAVRTGRNAEGVQGGRSCPVMFFMNGMPFPMTSDGVINSYINPEEVEGVEVYTGASQIPSQFNSSGYNARCGVVVIWTLNGKESRPGH